MSTPAGLSVKSAIWAWVGGRGCTISSCCEDHSSDILGKVLAALLVQSGSREAKGVPPSANGDQDLGSREEVSPDPTHVRGAAEERPLGSSWLIEEGRAHEGENDMADMAKLIKIRCVWMLAGKMREGVSVERLDNCDTQIRRVFNVVGYLLTRSST